MAITRHRLGAAVAVLVFGLLAACSAPDPLAELPQGEMGRVVRIIDGDALVLDTGLTIRLAGIEAPVPERRNRVGEPYADEATRALEDLALGRTVRLIYPGITRDRYDRALAYVETADNLGEQFWLNLEMVRLGAVRVRIYPDTARLGKDLITAEALARKDEIGLWGLAHYRVMAAASLPADARGFRIITGNLGPPARSERDGAACARQMTGTQITATIMAGASELCSPAAAEPNMYLRGYVREQTIEITHHLNVAPLDP